MSASAVPPGGPSLPGDTVTDLGPGVVRARLRPEGLETATHVLVGEGARLADMFAAAGDRTGDVLLRLVWALDRTGSYLVVECPVAGETYPQLSEIAPAAFHEECEIYEQFALRPAGGRPLNRVAMPPHAGAGLPRLGRAPTRPIRETHASHDVGGHAFEFPFGPVRMSGVESLYYGLVTSGEEVVDLFLFTWHKHRGVEWRLAGRSPAEALFFVERVEGLSAVANGWAFVHAVERALDAPVPAAAAVTRAVALELERLYNHAAATVALCQTTGLSVGQANAEIALERCLRLNAAVFGHRYLFGVLDVGGVTRPPDLDALRRDLPGTYGELRRVTDALSKTNSFLDRLEATGIVTGEAVHRLGIVGPVARAAGAAIDTRTDHPQPPFDVHRPQLAVREAGDALARYQVFLAEAADSVRLLGELGGEAGDGTARTRPGAGSGLGWSESARGESLAWVDIGEDGLIRRARLRPAAARNWRIFDDAARAQNVFTDIPIIEASFWLTVAGTAR
ncbi:MAG TPA: nickel-dependent hydrogenase large subunit [Mycobacteriales bacterium]|nr:nickel-dependent hydrogenase large subunit [Mycobacteriales bacterium]